jgi:hypothetical protein
MRTGGAFERYLATLGDWELRVIWKHSGFLVPFPGVRQAARCLPGLFPGVRQAARRSAGAVASLVAALVAFLVPAARVLRVPPAARAWSPVPAAEAPRRARGAIHALYAVRSETWAAVAAPVRIALVPAPGAPVISP